MLITNIVGFLAAFFGLMIMAPQVVKTIKTKKVRDVSSGMLFLFLLNSAIQTSYGLLINALPIIITNQIVFIIVYGEFIMKIKYSREK